MVTSAERRSLSDRREMTVDEPADGPVDSEVTLLRSIGATTWLARRGDAVVVARPWNAPNAPSEQHALGAPDLVATLSAVRSPSLVPVLGTFQLRGRRWLMSEYVPGVSLRRLLAVVTPTPHQVAYVVAQVADAVVELRRLELGRGRPGLDSVFIRSDGAVVLTDWAVSAEFGDGRVDDGRGDGRSDARAVADLLEQLVRRADRPVARRSEAAETVMRRLQRASSADTSDVSALAAEMHGISLAGDSADGLGAVRAELVALVALVARFDLPATVRTQPAKADATRTMKIPAHARTAPARAKVPSVRPHRRRGLLAGAGIASLVVVVVPVAFASGLVSNPFAHGSSSPAPQSHSAAPNTTSAHAPSTRKGPAVPAALAPGHLAFVSGVRLTPESTCRSGSSCRVRASISVTGLQRTVQMHWRIVEVDRCSNHKRVVSSGIMRAEPGWSRAYDTRSIRVPHHPVAIVGLTTGPVRVASAPLLVPARATC